MTPLFSVQNYRRIPRTVKLCKDPVVVAKNARAELGNTALGPQHGNFYYLYSKDIFINILYAFRSHGIEKV